jgi:hypothetical protein
MISAASRGLLLRAPNNKIHRLPAGREFFLVQASRADDVSGQWLVYSDVPKTRLAGVFRSARMQSVTGALLFNVEMTDTGEEFAVVLRESGVTVICIQLSPPKCPVATYHEYLESYCRLLRLPTPGERSVAGGESADGRVPSAEEVAFRFIRRAVAIVQDAGLVKAELSRHERGCGGESGIDALATLRAWKAKSDWYAPAEGQARLEVLSVGSKKIRPLRAVRRESLGTNLFTGAANVVLDSLAAAIARGPVGGMAGFLLAGAARRLRTLDAPTSMTVSEAWNFIESRRLPPRSSKLAKQLLDIRASLIRMSPHSPLHSGGTPFLLSPPELIFQDFVTAKCLVALGLPHSDVNRAMADAHTSLGCRFGEYIAWADTSLHKLEGWRDGTGKPACYEPDLIVVDTRRQRSILLDAKFRRDSMGLLPASGIKDIQAYMHEYGLPKAVVAVPAAAGDPLVEDVSGRGFTVRGIALTHEIGKGDIAQLSEQLGRMWNDRIVMKGATK